MTDLAPRARITGDDRAELMKAVAERYAARQSIRSIAEDLGRSYGNVHRLLVESGADLRPRGGRHVGPRNIEVDPPNLTREQQREYRERLYEHRPGRKR